MGNVSFFCGTRGINLHAGLPCAANVALELALTNSVCKIMVSLC